LNHKLFIDIQQCLNQKQNVQLTGLAGSAQAFVIRELQRQSGEVLLCLAASEEKAHDLGTALSEFGLQAYMFLARDFIFIKENISKVETERIATLKQLTFRPRQVRAIITTPGGLLHRIASPSDFKAAILTLKTGQQIEVREIVNHLVLTGYERVATVTRSGETAVRGGILDIFPVGAQEPYRIDFFGDQIDTIRRFDIDSQRSGAKEKQLIITPADELAFPELKATLLDYLPAAATVFLDEPAEFERNLEKAGKRYRTFIREAKSKNDTIKELTTVDKTLMQDIKKRPALYHSFFPGSLTDVPVGLYQHISQKEMETFHPNQETLFNRVKEWQKKDYTVQLALPRSPALKQLQAAMSDYHVTAELSEDRPHKGFVSPTLKLAIIGVRDMGGKKVVPKTRKAKTESRLLTEDLKIGDYVVHENYGLGIYHGVTQVETDGVTREYILLQYAGTDKLYLPVEKLDALHHYTASEDKPPRLNKLGGSEWERTRKKVTESIEKMAQELLLLYATRQSIEGYAFAPDTPWQRQFEADFPHEETPDQLKAIQDVKKDMEKRRPMDRLICGDVGYGKTEVAMRAAFKAVMDGKQVAVLVPTTVLAEQHLETFKARFEGYPTTVEALSRFKSPARTKHILDDLERGALDIIIATHRLLSRDVKFKDLGLLIIDEEHRFGVAQKEKIKSFKNTVDVLSLSATPIPRSLHMSLTGLRDLSVIETPPPERYPITTYVMEFSPEIITEAIMNELDRNGQVFFVHNRIHDIYRLQQELQQMLPQVSIGVGHGRMKEDELSRVMLDFAQGRHQVFLCTTIIESGLDMPNVNTIIVDEADKMGLAQLYQLRGRVGRSNRMAYAYLTYRPDKVITENATKRLNAVREFNELGAGMKIALRDLEIRGAGNILGAEQHGYIQAVGFDLYCHLLEQQASALRGEKPREPVNTQMDIDMDYYIPEQYIPDAGTKMRIYRRLLLAQENEEIEAIKEELVDRFGTPPPPVENFLQVAHLRLKARSKNIKGLKRRGSTIEIQTNEALPASLSSSTGKVRLRRLNDYTLTVQLAHKASLDDLQDVLNSI
jgi:transcription-repair coupling factor (superfamily II helicase)